MKNQSINVGVVGCGYWGPNLIRNFWALPDSSVKTACDSDPVRLDHMKKLYPLETTSDFEQIIDDPDIHAVAIATPVSSHYDLAQKSLMAGKHTFIEKPMTRTVEQGHELIELAARKNLVLMVGHTFIYSTPVRKIKEIVESGDIGDILYISAQRLNLGLFQKDINVAWDLAPHDISIILYIMGMSPVSVNCQGKNHFNGSKIEDVTNMSLNFPNGGFATILSSWLDPNKIRRMTFVGSKKMILYDDNKPLEKIKIYDKHVEVPEYYDTFGEFSYSYHYGDVQSPYLKQEEPLKVECQHFIDCIKFNRKPESSGEEGLKVVQILEAAARSISKNGLKMPIGNLITGGDKVFPMTEDSQARRYMS
ncbi:MAG: gfo/Idh/MocA family oxidoreductase [Desulfobacteraceae bacterium]|nr:MAG: gfo/Idh/MocA family oxidoreductase [Desulfobacteraceae bacterium]